EIDEFAVGTARRARERIAEPERRNELVSRQAVDFLDDCGNRPRPADIVPVNAAFGKQVELVGPFQGVDQARGIDEIDAALPERADILGDELRPRLWRARAGEAIDEIFRQVGDLGRRNDVNEDGAMRFVIILDVLQLRKNLGGEFRAHSFGTGAVFLEIWPLEQMALCATDDMRGGEFAEQFEANLVVDANEKRAYRHGFRDLFARRFRETAVPNGG